MPKLTAGCTQMGCYNKGNLNELVCAYVVRSRLDFDTHVLAQQSELAQPLR